jgi:cytochrome bd-type quinol oxidase subunit 2
MTCTVVNIVIIVLVGGALVTAWPIVGVTFVTLSLVILYYRAILCRGHRR